MEQTHIKLDAAIAAAMIKAREIGVKMLASDCEQILKASGLSDGVSVALKYLRNKVEEYDREYARQDYETGAWEFGSNAQEEYSNSMHELIEEIESLESLASAPEVGEAVDMDENTAKRFRGILSMLGISAPESDESLMLCQFSLLGMVRHKIQQMYDQPDRTAQIEADNKRLVEALKEADELIAIEPYEHVAQEAADAHRNIRALLADMEAKG